MAAHGAHLTATEQEKPSIFEVVACDSLHSTFHPAIKRLCNVSSERGRYMDYKKIINTLVMNLLFRCWLP